MKLLKFISYNSYLLEGLENQTLYFNNIYNFNDPFEGIFRFKLSSDYNEFKKFYSEHYIGRKSLLDYYYNNKSELEAIINKPFIHKSQYNAVCCFSEEVNINDIAMWSNYADSHKG